MSGARIETAPDPAAFHARAIGRCAAWSVLAGSIALGFALIRFGSSAAAVATATSVAVGALVVWIMWQDATRFIIADAAVLAIAVLACAGHLALGRLGGVPWRDTLLGIGIGAILPGGLLLLFREIYYRRKGHDGLGLGDVKLAAAGGILVGPLGFSWALLAASLAGLVFAGLRMAMRHPLERIAFGAVLAPALWAVWVAEQMPFARALVDW